jgi:hypothetical protein
LKFTLYGLEILENYVICFLFYFKFLYAPAPMDQA